MMTVDACTLKDTVSIAKDVSVAIAAIVASVVAVYGINGWRRETRGKARFDAARGLLIATYRVRDAIRNCRSSLIVAGEFPPDLDPITGPPEERYKAYAHVYSSRWAPVKEAMEKFDIAVLDAQVVLGESIRERSQEVESVARKVFTALDMYLDDMRSNNEKWDEKTRQSFRKVFSSSSTDDILDNDLTTAVQKT